MPRQIRDTFSPADPSRTYSTLFPLLSMNRDSQHYALTRTLAELVNRVIRPPVY